MNTTAILQVRFAPISKLSSWAQPIRSLKTETARGDRFTLHASETVQRTREGLAAKQRTLRAPASD